MILAILGALALAGTPATDTPTPAPAPQTVAPAPAPDADPVTTARDNLEHAETLFAQSCSNRSYGSYDDLCNELSGQVHQYHVALDRLVRTQSSKKKTPDAAAQN